MKTELLAAVRIMDPQDTPTPSRSGRYLKPPTGSPDGEASTHCPLVTQSQNNLVGRGGPYPTPAQSGPDVTRTLWATSSQAPNPPHRQSAPPLRTTSSSISPPSREHGIIYSQYAASTFGVTAWYLLINPTTSGPPLETGCKILTNRSFQVTSTKKLAAPRLLSKH